MSNKPEALTTANIGSELDEVLAALARITVCGAQQFEERRRRFLMLARAALAQQAATPPDAGMLAALEGVVRGWEALHSTTRYVAGLGDKMEDFEFREMQVARAAIASARQAATPAPAEPDAARYRWLRANFDDVYAVDNEGNLVVAVKGYHGVTGESAARLDAAIDSAMGAAPPATPAAQPADERNQCDGCQASMPMRGGIHTDEAGHAVMLCQRGRYALKGNA